MISVELPRPRRKSRTKDVIIHCKRMLSTSHRFVPNLLARRGAVETNRIRHRPEVDEVTPGNHNPAPTELSDVLQVMAHKQRRSALPNCVSHLFLTLLLKNSVRKPQHF